MRRAWGLFVAWLVQMLIAFDQLINAIIPPLTGTLSYADETLSARCYRAHRDGRAWGRLLLPCIDWLFSWQSHEPYPEIAGHCHRAYLKEHDRRCLPPEYRDADAIKDRAP